MNEIKIKRVYKEFSEEDGYRILVDRLWPRGIAKENAKIDQWAKIVSPSTELRKLFNHDENTMEEFKKRYYDELDSNKDTVEYIKQIKEKLNECNVTFLYAAKNEDVNHAMVLKEWIEEQF